MLYSFSFVNVLLMRVSSLLYFFIEKVKIQIKALFAKKTERNLTQLFQCRVPTFWEKGTSEKFESRILNKSRGTTEKKMEQNRSRCTAYDL